MLHTIIEYINMLFTNYLIAVFIVSGLFLLFIEAPSMDPERFTSEKKIARVVGIGYIAFGIGTYIILFFVNRFFS